MNQRAFGKLFQRGALIMLHTGDAAGLYRKSVRHHGQFGLVNISEGAAAYVFNLRCSAPVMSEKHFLCKFACLFFCVFADCFLLHRYLPFFTLFFNFVNTRLFSTYRFTHLCFKNILSKKTTNINKHLCTKEPSDI